MKKIISIFVSGFFIALFSVAHINAAQTFSAADAQAALQAEDGWLQLKYERRGSGSESKQEKKYKALVNYYLTKAAKSVNKNNKSVIQAWNRTEYPLYYVEYISDENRPVSDREYFVKQNNKLKKFYDNVQ